MKNQQFKKPVLAAMLSIIAFLMISPAFAQHSIDLGGIASQVQSSGLQIKTIITYIVNIILMAAVGYVVYLMANDKNNAKEALFGLLGAIVVFNVFMAILN